MKKLVVLEVSLLAVALRSWGQLDLPRVLPGETRVVREIREREERRHPVPGVVRRDSLPASRFEKHVASSFLLSSPPPRQFGYDVFLFQPSSFAPVADLPVGPDYTVGPGDHFRVMLWGKVAIEFEATVDRDGTLVLPAIGAVGTAGLTLKELKEAIRGQLDRHYLDYELSVTIRNLRTITVFVIGHVRTPGSYTLAGTSTAITALFTAGGPTKAGSVRAMRVLRGDEIVGVLDLYEFFLRGSRAGDVRLQSGDAVLVPPAGPLVAVDGAVKCPAIYELQAPAVSLDGLLRLARGLDFDADRGRVQLERDGELIDIDLNRPGAGKVETIAGDIVRVYRRSAALRNVVYVRGNVAEPAMYAFREGMRVGDLLSPQTLVRAGFWADRRRFASAKGAAARGQEAGHVDLDPAEKNLPEPYWEHALVKRVEYPSLEERYVSFHLGRALLGGDEEEDIELRPQDTVIIFCRSDFVPQETVSISGAVNKPGTYALRPGLGLRELLSIAGGIAADAAGLAQLTSFGPGGATHSEVKLAEVLSGPTARLSARDSVFLPRKKEMRPWGQVAIKGEVRFPGSFVISRGDRLSDILARAGGLTRHSYLRGAVFLRESVRKLQQEQLDQMIASLEAELASHTKSAGGSEHAEAVASDMRARLSSLIGRLKAARAKGRVVITLNRREILKGTGDDVFLEPGDSLDVPTKPTTVTVFGAVRMPSASVHDPSSSVYDYIAKCGGMTERADVAAMYVIRADGSTAGRRDGRLGGFEWSPGARRWVPRGVLAERPGPGDVVVVPEKIEPKVYPGRLAMDITQVLYQMAVATSLVVAVF